MPATDAQTARRVLLASGRGRVVGARIQTESIATGFGAGRGRAGPGTERHGNSIGRPRGSSALVASVAVGYLELTDVAYALPGGWTLFEGVTFRVPEGEHAALVGANGIGKSTLLRLIAGDERAIAGSIHADGRVGLMRQFIETDEEITTVRNFLLAYSDAPWREMAARLRTA